jgi:hypothetical protein
MKFDIRMLVAVAAATAIVAVPVRAQEIALKGGITLSRFQTNGPFVDRFVATAFGAHARFGFGRFALQPELQMVTRGAAATGMDTRMRLEYMELPIMLVVPVYFGAFETYAFGGPMLSLQARCRFTVEQNDLKTNLDCDDATEAGSFERRTIDYGVSAGAGVSRRVGSGRVLLEGRHTWGLRDIYDGPDADLDVRNRSFIFSIGYTIVPDDMD